MKPAFFVAMESGGWSVLRVTEDEILLREVAATEDEANVGQAVAESLKELGYQGQAICLGLPAEMVLAAEIDASGLPRRNRRSAMVYRLEELVPCEAERLTADFLALPGGRAFAAAVETDRVRAILDRLAPAGVEVGAVCPTALLALQEAVAPRQDPCEYVLVAGPQAVNVFRMSDGRPTAWYTAPPQAPELVRLFQADLLARPAEGERLSARVIGSLPPDIAAAVEHETTLALQATDAGPSALETAARGAVAVLQGRREPWADFRRDALAAPNRWRRLAAPVATAAALALVLIAAIGGLSYWRSLRYDRLARRLEGEMRAIYQNLYPNQQVPVQVERRLRSELARLAAVSGVGGALPNRPSALVMLRDAASALPKDLRVRIVEARMDSGGLLLEGETRSHTDAEAVAQALGRSGAFSIEPPRTEHLAKGGVTFTVVGEPRPERQPAQPGGTSRREGTTP
ncbi:MAG: type II secretion system protein GspL [Planctomycetota bacterium]|nr:type II secretion system protein GspL [Planctomycetota bacterium]